MKTIRTKRMVWIALVAVAMVFAFNGPSEARGGGGAGHSIGGHRSGGHFEGHHFEGHHFDGDRFHHGWPGGYGIAPAYPYYYGYDYAPDSSYAPPTSYWYCSSYGAYYPDMASCPDAWMPVPAS